MNSDSFGFWKSEEFIPAIRMREESLFILGWVRGKGL